jgi:hypothetical protein
MVVEREIVVEEQEIIVAERFAHQTNPKNLVKIRLFIGRFKISCF